MDTNDDSIRNLQNHLQLVEDFLRKNEGSDASKPELLEKLEILYKYTEKLSLTQEFAAKVEKTIKELKSQSERKTDHLCTEFYDLTDETCTTPVKNSSNRTEHEIYQFEGQRQSIKENSSYRESESKGTGTNGRLHQLISFSRSWAKYDERTESYSRNSPSNDTFSEASESSFSKDLCRLGRDIHTSLKIKKFDQSSSKLNVASYRDSRLEPRRDTIDGYRSASRSPSRREINSSDKYYQRRVERSKSRSLCRRGKNSPNRYCDRRVERSKSRSLSRRRRNSSDRYYDRRAERTRSRSLSKRGKKSTVIYFDRRAERTRSRSLSKRGKKSPVRYYDRRAERSKSRSRSRLRRDSTDRYRRSYSNGSGDKDTKRSKRRDKGTKRPKGGSRSRRRRESTDRYRHGYSSGKSDKGTKFTKKHSRSRRRRDSNSTCRRSYSPGRGTGQPKRRSLFRACEKRDDNGFDSGDKLVSNQQSDANYSFINMFRSKLQSTLAMSSNCNKNTKNNIIESSCRSHLFQDDWDLDVCTTSNSAPLKAETESLNQKTSVQITDLVPSNNKTQIVKRDSNVSAVDKVREKIQFTFAKSMKVDNLKASNAVGDVTTKNMIDVKSKLSNFIKSALNVRRNEKSVTPSLDRNIESNFWQRSEPGTFDLPKEQSMEFDIPIKANAETPIRSKEMTFHSSIDNDIIQKIISQSAKDSSTEQLAPNFPFDIDSVKRALATAKMNEDKNVSAKKANMYAGTALMENNNHDFKLQEIPSLRVQSQQKDPRLRSYCPIPVPQTVFTDPPMIQEVPVLPTPKQSPLSLTLISTRSPVNLPIPSLKFLPQMPLRTPALLHHKITPLKPDCFNTPFDSNVDRQKNQICRRRSTVYSDTRPTPATYGEYKKLKETKALNWNFKIPKKTTQKNINRSTFETMIKQPNSKRTEEPMDVVETDYSCENYSQLTSQPDENESIHLEKHSTENENVSDPVGNPSREQNTLTTLKELMSENQLVTLVDLMEQMTRNDTLMKVKEALKNCTNDSVTNEGAREGLSTSSSASNNDRAITDGKQNTQTTPGRSRSLSPTITFHEVSVEQLLTKQIKVSLQRMEDDAVPEKAMFKNIESEWHSLKKIVSCQVCDKPHGNSLISHYVNDHPNSEVLVSRLAPEAAELIRSPNSIKKCEILRKPETPYYEYKQFCFFCNVYKCFNRNEWFNHIARHTGYYRFKCIDCARQFSVKPIKHKCLKNNNFEKIAQPSFKKTDIKGYICDICNYARFHKKEIEKHLRNEHKDDTKKFKKVIFLTFPKKDEQLTRKFKKYKTKASRALDAFLDDFIVEGDLESETNLESEYETDLESEYESDWEQEFESEWEKQYALQKDDENEIESDYSDFSEVKEEIVKDDDWETVDSEPCSDFI